MLNICTNCGHAPPQEARFCPMCGQALSSAGRETMLFSPYLQQSAEDVIMSLVQSYKLKLHCDYIHLAPNIPDFILKNAISSYAPIGSDETALLLIDNTLFGNGKLGILLTNRKFYSKNIFEKPFNILLNQIRSFQVRHESLSNILIDGTEIVDISTVEEPIMHTFEILMHEIEQIFYPKASKPSDAAGTDPDEITAALLRLKRLYDAGVLSHTEYEDKRQQYLELL